MIENCQKGYKNDSFHKAIVKVVKEKFYDSMSFSNVVFYKSYYIHYGQVTKIIHKCLVSELLIRIEIFPNYYLDDKLNH
ncbi:MAG: hypothetical protein QXG00_03685 [Candidatus Woesearchaeota archaeon]